nr:murein biosynthesis integral membrane protein MurJ [Williamsia sterculiae]
MLRTSGSIAIATLTSRITGFIRTVLVLAMLGPAVASSFQAAYVLPNMVAEVVLGAVLTAIVIPVLVRAEAEDDDGGAGFINRIFTVASLLLGAATVIALIAAPLLTLLNLGDGKVNRPLATGLAYLLLPEILFYGMSALFIAILNMKGLFKPGAWAPVLNNIVQIVTLVAYAVAPGDISLNPVRMGDTKLLILGIGTTLGVVAQATVLLPHLRRAGVRLRWQWGIDDRLKKFGNMALAIVFYVAVLQVGLIITYRIAAHATASGVSVYATHWQLLQLPYGVLGVTILTAIMPRLSRNAAAKDTNAVVDDLSLATRLTMVALVPVISFMTFFGPAIALAVFNFGKFDTHAADQLGSVLSWGAFTMIPYAMTLVQLRVFYAREDAWTPTLMVVGITAVKVVASYLGPVLFSDPELVVRWLALSNGLGYLVGAVVGHWLLRRRLGDVRMTNVSRTTALVLIAGIASSAVIWALSKASGLSGLASGHGKIGSICYLLLTAVFALGLAYLALVALRVPDVIAISVSLRRVLGRFIPALAPTSTPDTEVAPTMTVQFPRINGDEALPYSGQVQVLRRFDQGTASWQAYSEHSGGAVGTVRPGMPRDLRYRRRGVGQVADRNAPGAGSPTDRTGPEGTVDTSAGSGPVARPSRPSAAEETRRFAAITTPDAPVTGATDAAPADRSTPAPSTPEVPGVVPPASGPSTPVGGPRTPAAADHTDSVRRGPRLIPGAAVAGGRYRLLQHHGGSRGLQFWRARDINLDRDVGLTFVDAEQIAPPVDPDDRGSARREGPQAVLSRTLRLGRVNSSGIARVLDVVRGSSGGIVVSEWVPGSSLAEVAKTNPSPVGAARAVRALAAAAEAAHRTGTSLSIDHPDRIRISSDGNAVLAFPGTLAGDANSQDVRGLGAVLYALLLAHWPLDPETGAGLATSRDVSEPIGGLPVAEPDDDGKPVEPRAARTEVPFEISAVAARALQGDSGIRTAATVQHVLDQATVLDQKTDLLPVVDSDRQEPTSNVSRAHDRGGRPQRKRSMRALGLIGGAVLLSLFLIIALIVWLSGGLDSDSSSGDIDSQLFPTTSAAATPSSSGPRPAPAAPAGPVTLTSVALKDYSNQPPDSSANLPNVLTGASPSWRTDAYRGGPQFGNLKSGLGLIFTMQRSAPLTKVTIRTDTPGAQVQIRTAPSPGASFDDTTQVAAAALDSTSTDITIANPRATQYFLVWITALPRGATSSTYQAGITQVTAAS